MILKVYQSPKSWIVVSTSIKKDTTLLECYHSANYFIFHHDDCEVKSSNITHSVIYLEYACTHLIGRVEIRQKSTSSAKQHRVVLQGPTALTPLTNRVDPFQVVLKVCLKVH